MPPPVPRCGKGQHKAKQIPCEDQDACSTPEMQGHREACSVLGSRSSELKWFPKPSQTSSFQPHKTPQIPSSGTGLHSCGTAVVSRQPCPTATSSPAPPEPPPTCMGRCWSKRDTLGSVQWVVVPWAAQWLLLGCRI